MPSNRIHPPREEDFTDFNLPYPVDGGRVTNLTWIDDVDSSSAEEEDSAPLEQGMPDGNTATRGRSLVQVSAGREQTGQPSGNEHSPSASGQTFNGFSQNLEPLEITDHRLELPREMLYNVRWRDYPETRLIESSIMREHRPDMVLDYMHAVVARLPHNVLSDD